jgi:hypothetical protein
MVTPTCADSVALLVGPALATGDFLANDGHSLVWGMTIIGTQTYAKPPHPSLQY